MAIQTYAADNHLRSSQAMGLLARTPLSITTWINATWNGGGRLSFVGIYGPAADTPLGTPVTAVQIGTTAGAGELSCWTWGGGVLVGTATAIMTPYNGQWVQITYTYDGTTHTVYRNGVAMATATATQLVGYLNQVYINGYPSSTTGEVSSFQTDQYALYRRCLTAGEVQTIYYAGGARHGITKDLICRYEYDELSANTACASVPDLTGNGHTLTVTGAGTPMVYTYSNTFANSNIRPVQ